MLYTNASGVAIGAVLQQLGDDGKEHPVSYASRVLTAAERNLSATERECLVVITYVRHFCPYLLCRPFTIVTDHSSLQWLNQFKDSNSKLTRWALCLSEYQYTVEPRPGRLHTNADTMSRPPIAQADTVLAVGDLPKKEAILEEKPAEETKPVKSPGPVELSLEGMREAQESKEPIAEWRRYLISGELPADVERAKRVVAEASRMRIREDGILEQCWWPQREDRWANTRIQIVVPTIYRDTLMNSAHDHVLAGHLGFDHTYGKLRDHYWWPNMYTDVKNWVKTCAICQSHNNPKGKPAGMLQPILVSQPFERIGIDYVGPLTETADGNFYMCVITEYATKWVEAFPTKDMRAKMAVRLLMDEIICRYGMPEIVTSDRGKAFIEGVFAHIHHALGIQQRPSSAYHPQTDGLTERANQTIKRILKKYIGEQQRDWDKYLRYAVFAYNTSEHASTHDTPFYLMFGRDLYTPDDVVLKRPGDTKSIPDMVADFKQAQQLAKENNLSAQMKQKIYYDRNRRDMKFKSGDKVMLKQVPPKKKSKKLSPQWGGPYQVLIRTGMNTYRIQGVDNARDEQTVHISRLKPAFKAENISGGEEVEAVIDQK